MKKALYILCCLLPVIASAQTVRSSLNGKWWFSLDPMKVGVQNGWQQPAFANNQLDKVTVPHCFSTDKRYFFYTGTAWYCRNFEAPQVPQGYRAFIHFDAVFYKTNVWLNGKLVGDHEGGYTPFEIEVTAQLQQKNTLSVQVDNSWDTTTIPGAKTVDTSYRANASQLYAWMNYGGITKPVTLIIRPDVFISKVKVNAEPDLIKGNAKVQIKACIKNLSATTATKNIRAAVYHNNKKINVDFKAITAQVVTQSESNVLLEATVPARETVLWSVDAPELYKAVVFTDNDTVAANFGIRKIEVKGTQLLLNGFPVKMGGANRPTDYPGFGSLDPDSILQKDLTLMKSAGMELSRIGHHAVAENLLNWADEHGMLIIAEAGNWQMTPKQMADENMRSKYRSQAKEMIERDWNHPSVIAYSLGNEFYSQTNEGRAWVQDMKAFTRSLDSTRLITFASYIVWRDYIHQPQDEASQYVDFISANIYGNHLKCLQHIHELYPNKPVYISEFGIRATPNKTEQDRMDYLTKAMNAIRQCDYVIGASVWSFNDYMSRYPESDADGYRAWGLVTPQRVPRQLYFAWQEAFAPATIELVKAGDKSTTLTITARKNFPSYTLKGYQLQCGNEKITLNTLQPGESQQVTITTSNNIPVALIKPGGYVVLRKTFTEKPNKNN